MCIRDSRKAILADLSAGGYLKETEPLRHDEMCIRDSIYAFIDPRVKSQYAKG